MIQGSPAELCGCRAVFLPSWEESEWRLDGESLKGKGAAGSCGELNDGDSDGGHPSSRI